MGVGAYASQDVFMREVKQVRNLFEGPLGLVGRAVSLVNNPATVWDTPLANLHNLKRATARLSGIMNVDQDILFLFVTSHGNEDASVAVGFGDLGLNDIYASDIPRRAGRGRDPLASGSGLSVLFRRLYR